MRIATYIINWLIVCLGCLTSWEFLRLFVPWGIFALGDAPLPDITLILLKNLWILWVVPLVWGIVTVFFLRLKASAEKQTFHFSASVFLGLFVFFICVLGVTHPFLNVTYSIR